MEDKTTVITSRAGAREYLFGLLFAQSFAAEEEADDFYARTIESTDTQLGDQADYIRGCFFGILEKKEELDQKIASCALGWTVDRLSRTSLAIMRLAVYEMSAVKDVPKRVALNEAVELAKKFDDDSAPAFINGVLNAVAHTLPDREIDQ